MTERRAFKQALAAISAARNLREWNQAVGRAIAEFDRLHPELVGMQPTGSTGATPPERH